VTFIHRHRNYAGPLGLAPLSQLPAKPHLTYRGPLQSNEGPPQLLFLAGFTTCIALGLLSEAPKRQNICYRNACLLRRLQNANRRCVEPETCSITTLGTNCDMIQTLPGPRDQLGSLERTRRSRRETPRFVLPSLLAPNTRTLLIVMLLAVLSAAPSMQLALWPTEGTFGPLSNLSSFGIGASPGSLSPGPNGLEKCKNVRWDADFSHNPHPGMPPRYVPVCADLTPRELRRLENARRFEERQTATPFSIRFTCTDSTQIVCEKAKLGFEKAGRRLAQVLKIDTTVVVGSGNGFFFNGTALNESLLLHRSKLRSGASARDRAKRAVLGIPWVRRRRPRTCRANLATMDLGCFLRWVQTVSYRSSWTSKSHALVYPQSLFKQINNGAQVSMREVDIIAEFNTDFKFWFEGDGPIARDQVDFELVVTHEFVGVSRFGNFEVWLTSLASRRPTVWE